MATLALIHGAGDSGWAWHRVADQLRSRGHTVVAPDLPSEQDGAGLSEYASTVDEALRSTGSPCPPPLVVVGHSLGAFTAPLVAEQQKADRLVLIAPMIPLPGETVNQWWSATGYADAAREQGEADGGLTNNADPIVSFYNDVPRDIAEEALRRERTQSAIEEPLPLGAWPDVPTRVLLFRDDRFLPVAFGRRLAADRLGVVAEELPGGHCSPLSHPTELAEALLRDVD